MIEGWTKDNRKIYEGYTAQVRLRYGGGTVETEFYHPFKQVVLYLVQATGRMIVTASLDNANQTT